MKWQAIYFSPGCFSPRHRMSFSSRCGGSKGVWSTWRAVSVTPLHAATSGLRRANLAQVAKAGPDTLPYLCAHGVRVYPYTLAASCSLTRP
jgi:hypothetical protein